MGRNNPPVRWADVGRAQPVQAQPARALPRTPYAELHCHSNFSFLDGASHPEELVEEAARLGLDAIAITDHDGMYGVVRFAEAARELGIRTVFGAEFSLGLSAAQNGIPDPEGEHLLVLARDPEGYRRLSRVISDAQLRGREKGRPVYDVAELAAAAGGHWVVLTGCRKAAVRRALQREGPAAAAAQLRRLTELFGREHVVVELTAHGLADDTERNDALAELAAAHGLGTVASTAAHYATPARHRLATVLAAVRARRSLDEMDGWLPAAATAHLRSGAEMAERFARWPGAVERAAALGRECAFDLQLMAPDLPRFDVPGGHTEAGRLRELTWLGVATRYGSYDERPGAYHQIEHELAVIEQKSFPGYFLIVDDIVGFCRRADILCQGRGSAANSAVCYALGITNVDAVGMDLLFERFLAPDRDGYPDIDLDIESGRREEVIQYVYQRYGRDCAAQVANVITYRPRSAVRDVAKALGYSTGTQDAWSKQIDRWGPLGQEQTGIPEPVLTLAAELEGFPRHLGIHSGGMVLCSRPVAEVCPVEWARRENRSVVQWDKDDCAAAGLVKFDLLGLGMLAALRYVVDLVARHYGHRVRLSDLQPTDPAVYEMLSRADSVGVFQVESRAQMATLPRLKPRTFYDLVVEVALIRPGPIQGGSVHPYLRRRNGLETWDYDHPLLANALRKTLGVPLFQEQLMQMAIDVADFSAAEADELRRAMGAKRSTERMERLRERLFGGMARHGITGELAEKIYATLRAFADYGFPESHSISFASLVYYSAWFKHYYPAAFCAALLQAQPMGFYSPQSLIADARRHGVTVRGPDINASGVHAGLEPVAQGAPEQAVRLEQVVLLEQVARPEQAVRWGLAMVRTVGRSLATRLVEERQAHGPYRSIADVAHRVRLTTAQAEALATGGAFDRLVPSPATGGGIDLAPQRRQALWAAGAVAAERPDRLPGTATGFVAPPLPGMSALELAAADVWATGVSPGSFPTQFLRTRLAELGVVPAADLRAAQDGQRVLIAGAVTHRQRPATAGGVTFLNLEDETGMVNVICSPGFWVRYRTVVRTSPALLLRGRLQVAEGVINVLAEHAAELTMPGHRDFR
ncbi:MAG: error-prone DNA polymerase [Pseudonocardiaceae bacterium]